MLPDEEECGSDDLQCSGLLRLVAAGAVVVVHVVVAVHVEQNLDILYINEGKIQQCDSETQAMILLLSFYFDTASDSMSGVSPSLSIGKTSTPSINKI